MPQWSDRERQMLHDLERELGVAELTAVLSEWVSASVHRVSAVTTVIGFWREQLTEQGWATETIEASLGMILDRLWSIPIPKSQVTINSVLPFEFDDDEETEDD